MLRSRRQRSRALDLRFFSRRRRAPEGLGLGEGFHIDIIGPAEEEADERDGPGPAEGRCLLPHRIPHQTRHAGHHERLIEGVPAEDLLAVQSQVLRGHQVFVIQAAGRAQDDGENQAHDPSIARADAFLLSREAQHHISRDGQAHADPLQLVQHQHRAGGVDRAHDRERQMLHREIPRHPGGEHQGTLQQDIFLNLPAPETGGKQEG